MLIRGAVWWPAFLLCSVRSIIVIPTYAPTLSVTIIHTYAPTLSIIIISTYAPILITSLLCTYLAWAVFGAYVVYELVGVPLNCGRELLLG